jgi:hypothetical protein
VIGLMINSTVLVVVVVVVVLLSPLRTLCCIVAVLLVRTGEFRDILVISKASKVGSVIALFI